MAENDNQQNQQNQQNNQQNQQSQVEILTSLLNAIGGRQERAANAVVRSFSEQYGYSEDELKELIRKDREAKASQPTEAQQKQIDAAMERANTLLISAEVKALGATMGLKDPDVALSLLDRKKITVKDDGKVEGVKEQLEALKKEKAYFFDAEKPIKTGMRQSKGEKGKFDDANAALRAVLGKG